MQRASVVVVGSANLDMVVQAERIPRPGETVMGNRFSMVSGGKGANQAVAAARLGAQVTFVARVGADQFGRDAAAAYAAEGIRTEHVTPDAEAAQGVALIVVAADGENAITVAPGANARLCPEDVDRAEAAIAECAVVLLQLEVPLPVVARAVELARRHGKIVILNPAPCRPLPDSLLALVDVLAPNETEAAILLGREAGTRADPAADARELLRRGPGRVIITLGAQGVLSAGADGVRRHPAPTVAAVDTTAAGDAFCGALAVFVAEGRPFSEAVDRAVWAAALSVTRFGAQPSLPTRAELEDFMRKCESN